MAKLLKFDDAGATKKLAELTDHVLKQAQADAERCIVDATRRRINYAAKAVGLKAKSIGDLAKEFANRIAKIDPAAIYAELRNEFDGAVAAGDYARVLQLYDNKGLLADASRILGLKGRKELEEFVGRALPSKDGAAFLDALRSELPKMQVKRTLGILAYGSLISDPRAEIAEATGQETDNRQVWRRASKKTSRMSHARFLPRHGVGNQQKEPNHGCQRSRYDQRPPCRGP